VVIGCLWCGVGQDIPPNQPRLGLRRPSLSGIPAFPYDAKGLLATAITTHPVLFLTKAFTGIYKKCRGFITLCLYVKRTLLREGSDVPSLGYGLGVHLAWKTLKEIGIRRTYLDLRTAANGMESNLYLC